MPITGGDAFIRDALRAVEEFKQECIETMKEGARVVTQELMDRTPVWSGDTVSRYSWDGVSGGRSDKPTPAPTGHLGLGAEPNRAGAESEALGAMEGVLGGYNDLNKSLTLTNSSDIWDLIDNGSAPTPELARNPGGVSVLGEQAAKAKLGDKFK